MRQLIDIWGWERFKFWIHKEKDKVIDTGGGHRKTQMNIKDKNLIIIDKEFFSALGQLLVPCLVACVEGAPCRLNSNLNC